MALDPKEPLNTTLLRVSAGRDAGLAGHAAGVTNEGYWGFPVRLTRATARPFTPRPRGSPDPSPFRSRVTTTDDLRDENGQRATPHWKQYETLQTGKVTPPRRRVSRSPSTARARSGSAWFPCSRPLEEPAEWIPTGPHANAGRPEAEVPAFPRWQLPRGRPIATRFDWKKTLGPLSDRPGHLGRGVIARPTGWACSSSCSGREDMNAEPVLAVYAGYSLKGAL